jgi:hypothetical protein
MNTFDKELKQFDIVPLEFENNFDDVGNINLLVSPVSVNQQYIAFALNSYVYNNEYIERLYDVSIKEFSVPMIESIVDQNLSTQSVNILTEENNSLKTQLNELIQSSNNISIESDLIAAKDIIVSLRIQLGEGTSPAEFSDTFPYLKI